MRKIIKQLLALPKQLHRKIREKRTLSIVAAHKGEIFIGGKTSLTGNTYLGKKPSFNGMTIVGG